MRISPNYAIKNSNVFSRTKNLAKTVPITNVSFTGENKEAKNKSKKYMPALYITAGALIGLSAGYFLKGKINLAQMKEKLSKNSEKIEVPELKDKALLALLALAGFGGYEAGKIKKEKVDEDLDKIIQGSAPIQQNVRHNAFDIQSVRLQPNPILDKHIKYFNGLPLLIQTNSINKKQDRYARAIDYIENIAYEKLTSTKPLDEITKENPTLWSITSEFAPIKEGGLGSVPPEIRNNMAKLGMDVPTFVPMYLENGISTFEKQGDKYIYKYKDSTFNLEHLAQIKMDTYRNGQINTIPVDFFLSEDFDKDGNKRKLILIKTDKFFDGTIYEPNAKTEESEKFAIMSKAVYEFAKLKMDGTHGLKDVEIYPAIEKVNAPDAMILNDWQASPIAALIRYKAPMENSYDQLSNETLSKMKDMHIITIGHNVAYQGSSQANNNQNQRKSATVNILNTLFDKYAYDIVSHSTIGVEKIDKDDEGLKDLDNVLLLKSKNQNENHINFLNIGIILSDYFHPVSQNYANELIDEKRNDLSYMLQWALVQKAKAGKLVGIINGNDFNNLSIEARKAKIKSGTGIDFQTYSRETSQDELMARRLANKISLYNDFILPFTQSEYASQDKIDDVKKRTTKLEFYDGAQKTNLPKLTNKELQETPILTSGGRLVSQKGIDILCGAIELLYKNWDTDFKGKNKPIFYIAGADGEGGVQRKIIEDMKDKHLSKEDNDRVLFAHGFAPLSAMMAACDFFVMPSRFEPCGLTQGESLAVATPVIASSVGGIVDTINRDGKFNGILTPKEEDITPEVLYKTIKNALNIYFDDKCLYNSMVKDSIDEDYSWIQDNKQGPVFDYLDAIGIKRENL